jgi:hypothetical protein
MAVELEKVVFHEKHMELANLDVREFEGVGYDQGTFDKISAMAQMGVAMTLMWEGRVIAFTGFLPLWNGFAEGWMIPTKYVGEKPLLLIRTLSRYIEGIVEDHKLHRIQTIAIDDKIHGRFLETLGFKTEGLAMDYVGRGKHRRYWARRF